MSDHYFSHSPEAPERATTFTVNIRGRDVEVHSSSGVFSSHRLDKGTAVLLDKAPETGAARVALDVGCGWGPITIALASEHPEAEVWGVDVNERSLELARVNTQAYENVTIGEASATLKELRAKGIEVDLLWSNPPIRIGKEALHSLLMDWLSLLAADGVAYLVVQKNLGADSLSSWLNAQGFVSVKYGSSKGFRVLEVRKDEP
ncbi:16S rRNA G1207 methylase RsmC [Arcanobacterium wilhelmae]|uniref:16S rRNA G1207 methylase RsmC n=1 Tax=Arcanobacterium wilhelmae TaxID=1803177 RepID=A0ABT9N995_9ACTO|nr:methyltransferase [Arcanobacterium wilhelmae]MDP9800270.1 16S rRNA G1207 methylase RsmC [Arcanobacterium wilhelmae]WFN89708.1 methyltransferase [Arcanobacterium wilhelmae]